MNINWYPGHMKKTKELINNNLKLVDIVLEILDARIPISSKNPDIDKILGNKSKIVVLNKSDLSDPKLLVEWIDYYNNNGIRSVIFNSLTGQGISKLLDEIKISARNKMESLMKKGRRPRPIRIMIVGIPNVGKSSLINKLAGKKTTKTGNKPGVTKGKQWVRIKKGIELLDTPGILWPKIDNLNVGLNLAFTGSIKDEILDIEEITVKLVETLTKKYPHYLKERYKLENVGTNPLKTIENIGKIRGCIRSGGQIDFAKACNIILDEFRKGKIGRVTLESPKDLEVLDY